MAKRKVKAPQQPRKRALLWPNNGSQSLQNGQQAHLMPPPAPEPLQTRLAAVAVVRGTRGPGWRRERDKEMTDVGKVCF